MLRFQPTRLIIALALVTVAVVGSGCGQSEQEAERARAQAAEQKRLREKAAGLEEEIKQLRAQQPPAAASPDKASPRKGPSRACGAGVAAGPETSCAFALNTAREWVDTSAGQTIQVFSPATKRSYTMRCRTNSTGTTCRGGKGATVYIP